MCEAIDNTILNEGYPGVFDAVNLSGCTSWKLPHITILAFFVAGPPCMLGFETRISLVGNGTDVACSLGISP